MKISVVIPVYKGEPFIEELYERLTLVFEKLGQSSEIIFVNDASPDNSWSKIKAVAERDDKVVAINLSRNFGQHAAITAGLQVSRGEHVVVMDCDLQDVPEEIEKLHTESLKGNKVVVAQRINRRDKFFKRKFSQWFYNVLGYMTGVEQDATIANFGIYHRSVVNSVLSMGDYVRYLPAMIRWVGFDYVKVEVDHAPRKEGESSYRFKDLLRLGFNVITTFSDRPLRLTVRLGVWISVATLAVAAYYLVLFCLGQIQVLGFTSLIISVWLLSGVIITILGLVGIYVGKIFDQVKHRPVYLIRESINYENSKA